MSARAFVFCPGRGSYGREELGSLRKMLRAGPVAEALQRADAERSAAGLPAIAALDAMESFKPGLHLSGIHAAGLIYFATLASYEQLRTTHKIVGVAGNSLGWYTALAVAGVLSPYDGWQLVRTMAELQAMVPGGQVLTTAVDADWLPDAAAQQAIEAALAAVNAAHFAARSIRLGGHEVLAGTDAGIEALLRILPKRKVGEREFPFRLAGHGPFHTVLCNETAEQALPRVMQLPMRQPEIPLIDGFGRMHSPWSADPREVLRYTATLQVVETFDFSACVRGAIREFQPDLLIGCGPGTSLRAPIGHVVLREGWRGLRSRDALFAAGVVR